MERRRFTPFTRVSIAIAMGSILIGIGGPVVSAGAALEAPKDLAVARLRPDVVIRWNHRGSGVTAFQVERSTAGGRFERLGAVDRDTRTFRDRGARAGVAHTYRVRAVAGDAVSAYSTEVVVTVAPR